MGIRTYITRLVRLVMTGENGDETSGESGGTSAPNSDDERAGNSGAGRSATDAAESTPDAVDAEKPDGSGPNETVATAASGDVDDETEAEDAGESATENETGDAGESAADGDPDSDETHADESADGPESGGAGDDRETADDGSVESDDRDGIGGGSDADGSERNVAETTVAGTAESGPDGDATDADTADGATDADTADGATDATDATDTGGSSDAGDGDDGEWQLGTILSAERLEAWAAAAADDVVGERHEEINPSRHDPDRLERKVRRIDPDSMDDVERITSLSQEVFRRRKAYIAELEERVAALDERVEELEADYEQEVSQLNSLMDRKEDQIDELQTYGHESLVGPVISEVRSDLVGAVSHDDPDAVQEAAEYALDDLHDVLRAQGVSLIEPDEGESFDRDAHRAVTRAEDHRPEGTVVSTQQPGFRIEGEVREKANVVISDGSGTAPGDASEPEDEAATEPDETSDGNDERIGTDEASEESGERAGTDEASDDAKPEDRETEAASARSEVEADRAAADRESTRSETRSESEGDDERNGNDEAGAAERDG
ncbi:nucleotide exchange factor GrpE [Halorubrum sodomense]|uniref:Molecular chaperone GrpE (Heat shock protein) n=1 Tax=Halorubrum sodomense TaxID=35743 RepID=A0A1I6G037_HALSD|nr:nucleotide exchange factor GrpE [Halorubrum sodomense]SFR35437.1 Molecular chaperone GrpE (heat shock protein) [Halorubrum sodomense]